MNRRLLTILLVAFFIAAICTFLVYRLVGNKMTAVRPAATTGVVAVKADIKLGSVLVADNLTSIQIAGTPPKGAIPAKDVGTVIGRGVVSDLYAGEPILENRLAAVGSGGGLAATIPIGMRACSVKVDDVVGVSGFVTPGMRVDVLVSGVPPGTPPTTDQGPESRTLLQNIQVLSAGADIQKDAEGKAKVVQSVNLLVTPEDAESLSLASNLTIRLVLRNPLDTKVSPVAGTNTGNIFADKNAAPKKSQHVVAVKSRAPEAFSIEVMNGSKQSQEKFASPEGHK